MIQPIQVEARLNSKSELGDRIQPGDQQLENPGSAENEFSQVVLQVEEDIIQANLLQETTDTQKSVDKSADESDDQISVDSGAIAADIRNSSEIAEQVLNAFPLQTVPLTVTTGEKQVSTEPSNKAPNSERAVAFSQHSAPLQTDLKLPNSIPTQSVAHADKTQQPVITSQAQVTVAGADTSSLQQQFANNIDVSTMPAIDQGARTESLNKPVLQQVIRSEHKWGEQMVQTLRDQVQLQVNQKVQQATIRLDPPELGSLEILISHESGRLTVTINASQSDVARLIQHSSDRLRSELAQGQFNAVDVRTHSESNPGHQHSRQHQSDKSAEQIGMALSMEQDGTDNARTKATDILVTV